MTFSGVFKYLLWLEPLLLLFMVYAFWYPIEIRYQWMGFLISVPIIMLVRLLAYGRLFSRFPLDIWFVLFLVLGVLNLYISPFTAANPLGRLYLLGRPLLGMALCIYFVEYARLYRKLDGLLLLTLFLALLIGAMALLSSDWNDKSKQLVFILRLIPRFDKFPGAVGGFNANEIAGGLTWTVPLCAGLMFWQGKRMIDRVIRWGFIIAFIVSFAALFLGQSRLALIGVFVVMAPMIYFLARQWRWRIAGWVILGVFVVFEILIIRGIYVPSNSGSTILSQRDTTSVDARLDIWASALRIIHDHPITGAGMNMFREQVIRRLYPAPAFTQPVLPHAHNEFLQVATDLGIPGLIIFVAWYVVAFWNLLRVYKLGNNQLKALAIGVAGGLLAHIAFGMGDAVALWDRLAFLFWWLLALTCASYWLMSHTSTETTPQEV